MQQDAERKLREQIRKFRKMTPSSREAWHRARRVLPGGVSGDDFASFPYPLQIEGAEAARIKDADGNSYIDYNMGSSSLILGHGDPKVMKAISSIFDSYGTNLVGATNPLEMQLATEISDIVRSAEMVAFTSSGTEANLLALRIAMGNRRKGKVAKFEGHYHGSFDYGLISCDTPREELGPARSPYPYSRSADIQEHTLYRTVVMPFNRLEETEAIIKKNRKELSCLIMEPVAGGYRAATRDFMRGVREITDRYDIPLILDEITTGFRLGLGGAQERYRITPDMTTLGKILGGGFPIGAVAGSRDLMDSLDRYKKGAAEVYHGGTFNGNPISMAAGLATLSELRRGGTYAYLEKISQTIRKSVSSLDEAHSLNCQVLGLSSIINIVFSRGKIKGYRDLLRSDGAARKIFDIYLLNNGIFNTGGMPMFVSTAITKPEMRRTVEVIEGALRYMAS
ncbi:MAG: aspartate aminotransferase family protein [Thermoplasmata archaeon]|jgi:glutamate-1-semialdehyde 2,1-aminomutase|nr:aspartate aminotransferase family protein [Candidatus Sysuiplasma jiujiangense]